MYSQVTSKVYYIKGQINCESTNIIYLITCMKCLERYVDSAIKFKSRFKNQKSDIRTKKDRCGISRQFNNRWCIPPIPLYSYVSSSLRKYIVFMATVLLKIFYRIEKNIGSPSYLQM